MLSCKWKERTIHYKIRVSYLGKYNDMFSKDNVLSMYIMFVLIINYVSISVNISLRCYCKIYFNTHLAKHSGYYYQRFAGVELLKLWNIYLCDFFKLLVNNLLTCLTIILCPFTLNSTLCITIICIFFKSFIQRL